MNSSEEASLKTKTEDYWQRLADNDKTPWLIWRDYVEDLLPLEMEQHTILEPCDMLVLLVGHSVEPLLQAVWAYKPKQVVLILNRQYGGGITGGNFYIHLCDLFRRLPEDFRLSKQVIQKVIIQQATPATVFGALVDKVGKEPDVIVDITGAKKSMVAGAFLYAAYARVPVSYVDFDDEDYNTHYNRPYGYASKIRLFANPYEQFALRDWERVRQLYARYYFAEARRLLLQSIQPMIRPPYFKVPESSEAIQHLSGALEAYQLWDEGDFGGAADLAVRLCKENLNLPLPSAITTIAAMWPRAIGDTFDEAVAALHCSYGVLSKGSGGVGAQSLYTQRTWIVTYAYDELARIHRLIDFNEDFRSAFLRSASLSEVLMKARLAYLYINKKLCTPEGKIGFDYADLIGLTAGPMLNILTGQSHTRRNKGVELSSTSPTLDDIWPGCKLNLEKLHQLRNSTVHTYLPIPEMIATEAWKLACLNLENYCEQWWPGPDLNVDAKIMPWPKLCQLCGVDKFLPPNLLKEVPDEVSIGC